jgi:hypothetical protein
MTTMKKTGGNFDVRVFQRCFYILMMILVHVLLDVYSVVSIDMKITGWINN